MHGDLSRVLRALRDEHHCEIKQISYTTCRVALFPCAYTTGPHLTHSGLKFQTTRDHNLRVQMKEIASVVVSWENKKQPKGHQAWAVYDTRLLLVACSSLSSDRSETLMCKYKYT